MQVKSIAECSNGSILHYFRPSLSYHLSLRCLFCLFLSGRIRHFFCSMIHIARSYLHMLFVLYDNLCDVSFCPHSITYIKAYLMFHQVLFMKYWNWKTVQKHRFYCCWSTFCHLSNVKQEDNVHIYAKKKWPAYFARHKRRCRKERHAHVHNSGLQLSQLMRFWNLITYV